MLAKPCIKCAIRLPLTMFYKHPMMADGRLNKCKECAKKDAATNRTKNIDRYKRRDQVRASLPHRIAARKKYRSTHPEIIANHKKNYKIRHPDRFAAVNAVYLALRRVELVPLPCLICGDKAEAHHPDYSMPLDVVWLCPEHHRQTHALVKEK